MPGGTGPLLAQDKLKSGDNCKLGESFGQGSLLHHSPQGNLEGVVGVGVAQVEKAVAEAAAVVPAAAVAVVPVPVGA